MSTRTTLSNIYLENFRGFSDSKEYIHFLHEFYQEEEKYEIEIVDGLNFQAKKYFDITTNNWKLDNLIPKMLEANKVCKEISNSNS